MTNLAIETEELCRDFNGLRAVDHLDLQVPRGVIFGFLGPNGAGKTTTIRLLLGLIEPTAGSAYVLGFDVRREADRIRERVGVLLENHGLYERLTAWDNLEYFGEIYLLPREERRGRIEELLRHLGLWERRNEPVSRFSKGMKQKLAMARALLHRPPLVFLDEPTAGLDAPSAAALREDIVSLARKEGTTVFLTTHNLAEAERICDLVGVINHGKLVAIGSPEELRAQASRPRLEIKGRNFTAEAIAQLSALPMVQKVESSEGRLIVDLKEAGKSIPLVGLLVRAGAEIEEVRRLNATLEEAFLALLKEEER